MFVQRIRAPGRQSPEPRAKIVAPGALQVIRVWDFHQVGGPPKEIFRLDQNITLNGFHGLTGERFAVAKVNQLAQSLANRGNSCDSFWPTNTATINAIRLVTSKLRRLCLENNIHFPSLAECFLFTICRELS